MGRHNSVEDFLASRRAETWHGSMRDDWLDLPGYDLEDNTEDIVETIVGFLGFTEPEDASFSAGDVLIWLLLMRYMHSVLIMTIPFAPLLANVTTVLNDCVSQPSLPSHQRRFHPVSSSSCDGHYERLEALNQLQVSRFPVLVRPCC